MMNQYSEDVHAQFGNVRAVLELADAQPVAVAHQLEADDPGAQRAGEVLRRGRQVRRCARHVGGQGLLDRLSLRGGHPFRNQTPGGPAFEVSPHPLGEIAIPLAEGEVQSS